MSRENDLKQERDFLLTQIEIFNKRLKVINTNLDEIIKSEPPEVILAPTLPSNLPQPIHEDTWVLCPLCYNQCQMHTITNLGMCRKCAPIYKYK